MAHGHVLIVSEAPLPQEIVQRVRRVEADRYDLEVGGRVYLQQHLEVFGRCYAPDDVVDGVVPPVFR